MRNRFVIILLFFATKGFAQSTNCNSYIGEKVVFEKIEAKIDWAELRKKNPGAICIITGTPIYYQLRTINPDFQILSFVISAVNDEGDIIEASNTDSIFSAPAKNAYNMAAAGKDVYFYCIKAKHKNGDIFTLQPLTIRR